MVFAVTKNPEIETLAFPDAPRPADKPFAVVDTHPIIKMEGETYGGDIVEGWYATEEEAKDYARELALLEDIQGRYEEEVQLAQMAMRAWVNREALDAGIDVTVLEEHVGYGRNTL
tara:strand:- start:304 stop:651 length:348 start_codon:yes stop_codon:yes gene_type:complete